MINQLSILSQRDNIEKAFKSMIKSGRPDIRDEDNNNILSELYVDLFEGDYFLQQALDSNHAIFKGRRGTGKSTIFLQAEEKLKKERRIMSVYINLQSCYEEVRSSNVEEQAMMDRYVVYVNFFTKIMQEINIYCKHWLKNRNIDNVIEKIKNGEYIDEHFRRTIQVVSSDQKGNQLKLTANNKKQLNVDYMKNNTQTTEQQQSKQEMRIFSINKILSEIKEVLRQNNIDKLYLFLDDFGELSKEVQELIVDSLVAPIISSYNDIFVVKLAAYPYRIYLGNIDSSKIITYSLDFYDVYEQSASNYNKVEGCGIDYVRRTLKKRIEVYTQSQMDADELFDTSKESIDQYYKTLFYASAGIPRCLGYILNYSYLSSINKGMQITLSDLNNGAKQYYNNNILPDFYNDSRYKQSFFDNKKILSQMTQKTLMDELIKLAKEIKRNIIKKYLKEKTGKKIFVDTIEKYKSGIVYWLPTSHFYVDKDIESILQTLELYYIVSKFNEGSSRKPGVKVSYYGLNYGLCLENTIDYGKPELRRTYDYWRQNEFDYSDFIPAVINKIEVPICRKCGYRYTDKSEYKVAKKFGYCLQCKETDSIEEVNNLAESYADKIASWGKQSMPDIEMDILRVLYNNRGIKLSAAEIGSEIEKHHLAVTKVMEKLIQKEYVSYEIKEKRYYSIEETAIEKFFDDETF